MPKTLTLKNIPRNVWILGLVSLFTDTASKIIQSFPGIIAVLLLIFGIKEKTLSQQNPQNPLQWQNWRNLDRGYWILLVVVLIFNLGNSSDAFLLLRCLRRNGAHAPSSCEA